jgi:hypothetical protein
LKFGDIKRETEVQMWQLKIRHTVQTTSRKKLKNKLKANANYVKNIKKLLATQQQDVPFLQSLHTSTFLNMQEMRHRNSREQIHTHTQGSM